MLDDMLRDPTQLKRFWDGIPPIESRTGARIIGDLAKADGDTVIVWNGQGWVNMEGERVKIPQPSAPPPTATTVGSR